MNDETQASEFSLSFEIHYPFTFDIVFPFLYKKSVSKVNRKGKYERKGKKYVSSSKHMLDKGNGVVTSFSLG